MIYITEVRMSRNGKRNEHIEAVRWEHRGSPEESGESSTEEMIDWIDNKEGFVHVRNGEKDGVPVHVVHPAKGRPFLKTKPDEEEQQDDLLDLPRYGVMPGEVA